MSVLAYAKRRGVQHEAVRRAVREGRLERSVVIVNGKPKIADPELADREWAERTQPRIDYVASQAARAVAARSAPGDGSSGDPDYDLSYEEARRRREVELWRQARVKREVDELDLATKRGELVTARDAATAFADMVTVAKTRLLGVPSRLKQRAPHIATEDVALLDDLLREALESLADGADEGDP